MLEVPENKVWLYSLQSGSQWLLHNNIWETIDKNMLKDLHEHLNIKMKRLSVIMPYDGITVCWFRPLFNLNGNKTKVWTPEEKDSRLFLDKVKDLDKTEDCILE